MFNHEKIDNLVQKYSMYDCHFSYLCRIQCALEPFNYILVNIFLSYPLDSKNKLIFVNYRKFSRVKTPLLKALIAANYLQH